MTKVHNSFHKTYSQIYTLSSFSAKLHGIDRHKMVLRAVLKYFIDYVETKPRYTENTLCLYTHLKWYLLVGAIS